jgi:GNAT superfamily N-acetyltransferase
VAAAEIHIREYRPEDESEWMRVHAIILSISHSWNYSIQERPMYEGYASTKLVALHDGKIVGLSDTQYETKPNEFCFLADSLGGYVLEFGRLPEYGAMGIGKLLIDATVDDAKRKGFNRLEYWSQDRNAQRYYARLGLPEIGRHYRFRFKPPKDIEETLRKDYIGVEYLYGACMPEEWPLIKKKYDIVTKHPLEPHLCVGYEIRW